MFEVDETTNEEADYVLRHTEGGNDWASFLFDDAEWADGVWKLFVNGTPCGYIPDVNIDDPDKMREIHGGGN